MSPVQAPDTTPIAGIGDAARRTATGTIGVLIADADPLARQAIRSVLEDEEGFAVVPGASNGIEAIELVRMYKPDCVLIDLGLPAGEGGAEETIGQIVGEMPGVRVVTMAVTADTETQLDILRAGGLGCLPKSVDPEIIPRVVRAVVEGEAAISRRLTLRVIERLQEAARGERLRPIDSPLTPREWEVLDLLAQGCSTEGIARALELTPDTVYSHVKRVLKKLEVHSRAEAIEIAQRMRNGADF